MNPSNGKIIVTFYFVSGEKTNIEFSDKQWVEMLNSLKKGWGQMCSFGPTSGINFSLVTHYEVKE